MRDDLYSRYERLAKHFPWERGEKLSVTHTPWVLDRSVPARIRRLLKRLRRRRL